MSDAPVYTTREIAAILARSGCNLDSVSSVAHVLVENGIRPSQCGEEWDLMIHLAKAKRAVAMAKEGAAFGFMMAVGFAAYAFLTMIEAGAV